MEVSPGRTALVVAAGPDLADSDRLLAGSAVADVVIAVDGGAVSLDAIGIVPDVVIGDMDSLPADLMIRLADAGVEFVRHPRHKDHTDLDLALQWACESGVAGVTVTGISGGRLDHTLGAVGVLARHSGLCPELLLASGTGYILSARDRESVTLAPVGATVSVLALNGPATLSAVGLEWSVHDLVLEPLSDLGVSNQVIADSALMSVSDGKALVVLHETIFDHTR